MKISNCCKSECIESLRGDLIKGYGKVSRCTKCKKICTPIEEPTEENYKHTSECELSSVKNSFDAISAECTCLPKGTCEEEWGRRFVEKFVEFAPDKSRYGAGLRIRHTGTTEDREILDDIKAFIRSLIAQKEATAREEGRKELAKEIRKGLLAMGAVSINGSEMLVELEKVLTAVREILSAEIKK